MDALAESSLVAALKSGDDGAAETLVRTYGPRLLAVATRILNDRALAEDCLQETFLAAFRKIDGFEERASLRSWLHRIAVNQALMKLRSRKAKAERPIDDLQPEFDADHCRLEPSWSQLATPEEIFEDAGRRALVRRKIEELPESYALVLKLRDIEELTTAEVAEALDTSEANVRVRLHRARAALKVLLEPLLKGEV